MERRTCSGDCEHWRIFCYELRERHDLEKLKLCEAHAEERDMALAALAKGDGGHDWALGRHMSLTQARMLVEAHYRDLGGEG